MTRGVRVALDVSFNTLEEAKRVFEILKGKYEIYVAQEPGKSEAYAKGFDVTLYLDVPNTRSSDEIFEEIAKDFDRSKVYEGYLDVWDHSESFKLELDEPQEQLPEKPTSDGSIAVESPKCDKCGHSLANYGTTGNTKGVCLVPGCNCGQKEADARNAKK